jgi:ubiquitin-protein ligase
MKFRTIIVAILIGLLAATLFTSCRLNKQERRLKRDSETIEKIRGRSPELFTDKIDTIQTEDSIEVGVTLVEDSAKIRELIEDYIDLDSAKQINHDNKDIDLEQKALRHQLFINKQNDIKKEIARSGFKKREQTFTGPNYNLKVSFDPFSLPQIKLTGTIHHMQIDKKTTIVTKEYIHTKVTMKQAFLKLWPVWSIMLLLSILGAAMKFIIKQ